MQLTKGQNVVLPSGPLVVELRCAAGPDVSALLLGENGLVPDDEAFVFYNNPTAPGVRLEPGTGVVRLHLDPAGVPSPITRIVITASLDGTGAPTFATAGPVAMAITTSGEAVAYTIDDAATETAMLCLEVYRRGADWRIRALGQGYADGLAGIARDFGVDVGEPEAAAAPAPAPVAAAPVSTKVNLDKGKISLTKGQTVSLVKTGAPALDSVTMGLGWDPAGGGKAIDLDASVLAYDSRGNDLAKVWFMALKAFDGAIVHTGDNVTGKGDGDDEQIRVHLSGVPATVTTLLFTVNSFTGQTFDMVARAYCRLLDQRGEELVRFELSDTPKSKGVFMCRLDRTAGGTWDMTALGVFEDARTVKGMHKAAQRLFF